MTRELPDAPLPTPAPIVTRTGREPLPDCGRRVAAGPRRGRTGRLHGPAGRPGIGLEDRLDRLAQDLGRVLEGRGLLGPELDLELAFHALAPDHGGDRKADVADAVGAVDQRGDRQDPLLVQRRGVDDVADRQPDGEPGAALELDHLGAAAARPLEERLGRGRVPAGESLERAGRRPGPSTRSGPCCRRARRGSSAVTCVGGRPIPSAIRLRNRAVSSTVPSPMTWLDGRSSCRAARYVSTSTGLETTRMIASRLSPAAATWPRMFRNSSTLRLIRSRRLSSGLRRRPAVMTTASLSGIASYPVARIR